MLHGKVYSGSEGQGPGVFTIYSFIHAFKKYLWVIPLPLLT